MKVNRISPELTAAMYQRYKKRKDGERRKAAAKKAAENKKKFEDSLKEAENKSE